MKAKIYIDNVEYLINIKEVQVGGSGFSQYDNYLVGKCKERYVKGTKDFHMTLSSDILEKLIFQAQKKYPNSSQWMTPKQRIKKESKNIIKKSEIIKIIKEQINSVNEQNISHKLPKVDPSFKKGDKVFSNKTGAYYIVSSNSSSDNKKSLYYKYVGLVLPSSWKNQDLKIINESDEMINFKNPKSKKNLN
jgi:hypothetical protein